MAFLRKARECALQMLYQAELTNGDPLPIEASFWKSTRGSAETRLLADQMFEGALAGIAQADQMIARHSANWRVERLAAIDRSILRLAVHELRRGETPPKVVINEALELAKKFSEPKAVGFVNAVLDAIRKSLPERENARA